MTVYDVIERKKNKCALCADEIGFFVRAVADGSASDAQIAAFCMAVLLNGMTDEECRFLTSAMVQNSAVLPRPQGGGVYADKHSTGGVSDTTTLVLIPLLAALGVKCAKYSGRGLGHTGGTLDKLESFPGLSCALTPAQFEEQVERIGAAVAGQTQEMVPADKRMYAVRDVTATVDSIPLIASSIMSKKLVSFADVILLDVKCGEGAFMHSLADARRLARLMVSIGKAAGRTVMAAVTDMDSPLGDSVGCNAEVREAIAVLKGRQNRLSELSVFFAAKIARRALGIAEEEARRRCAAAIGNGAALQKLKQIVTAQGGDARFVEDETLLPLATGIYEVRARADGLLRVAALPLGKACVELGGGRKRAEDGVDHTVGILLHRRTGDRVRAGELVAEVRHAAPSQAAFELAESAFTVGKAKRSPLVYQFIE